MENVEYVVVFTLVFILFVFIRTYFSSFSLIGTWIVEISAGDPDTRESSLRTISPSTHARTYARIATPCPTTTRTLSTRTATAPVAAHTTTGPQPRRPRNDVPHMPTRRGPVHAATLLRSTRHPTYGVRAVTRTPPTTSGMLAGPDAGHARRSSCVQGHMMKSSSPRTTRRQNGGGRGGENVRENVLPRVKGKLTEVGRGGNARQRKRPMMSPGGVSEKTGRRRGLWRWASP